MFCLVCKEVQNYLIFLVHDCGQDVVIEGKTVTCQKVAMKIEMIPFFVHAIL